MVLGIIGFSIFLERSPSLIGSIDRASSGGRGESRQRGRQRCEDSCRTVSSGASIQYDGQRDLYGATTVGWTTKGIFRAPRGGRSPRNAPA